MTATTVGRRVGWAPQWWRSGVRSPLWWLVGASALGWLWGTVALFMRLGYQVSFAADAWAALGQTTEILVGLLFWMWRPGNVVGPRCSSAGRRWLRSTRLPTFCRIHVSA